MNLQNQNKPVILIAEDDWDDRLLLEVAFSAFEDSCELRFAQEGRTPSAENIHISVWTISSMEEDR